jgi:uncharacterized protein (TIGR02001 family)
VLLGALLFPAAGAADPAWSGSVAGTTNYVYRGISQTSGGGALQLGANYQDARGWFAGAWGSNVDPYPGGASYEEVDLYAGILRALGDEYAIRATYTHYGYLQGPHSARYDRNEASVSVTYLDLLAATVSYSPDSSYFSTLGFAGKRAALAYELSSRWPLRFGLAATAGAGYYDLHDSFGIAYWAADWGLSYQYRRLTLDVERFFCNAVAGRLYEDASANGTWVLTAALHF